MKFHRDNTMPVASWIWVFGSNLAGRHGKGAARVAHVNFQARYGVGRGRTGNAYAVPTKDKHMNVLPLDEIKASVDRFIEYVELNPRLQFYMTRVACGLAGYTDAEIAPMFAPLAGRTGISWPEDWRPYLIQQNEQESQDGRQSIAICASVLATAFNVIIFYASGAPKNGVFAALVLSCVIANGVMLIINVRDALGNRSLGYE